MADLIITAANVIAGSDANIEYGTAGATITAGHVVYLDDVTGRMGLADSNSATPAIRKVRGIALNGAANGQPVAVHRSGSITIGATLVPGQTYLSSETPGGIEVYADLTTGEYTTILGVAASTTVLNVKLQTAGVAI